MPKRNVSATKAPNDGASATQAVATAASTRPPRVAVRLPTRAASAPAGGIATMAPSATAASARPSWPSERSSRSRIAGIRVAQAPKNEPLARNTANTAQRAARTGSSARVGTTAPR